MGFLRNALAVAVLFQGAVFYAVDDSRKLCRDIKNGKEHIRVAGVLDDGHRRIIAMATSAGTLMAPLTMNEDAFNLVATYGKAKMIRSLFGHLDHFHFDTRHLLFFLLSPSGESYICSIHRKEHTMTLNSIGDKPTIRANIGKEVNLQGVSLVMSGEDRAYLLNANCKSSSGNLAICQVGTIKFDSSGQPATSWYDSCTYFCVSFGKASSETPMAAFYSRSSNKAFYFFSNGTIWIFNNPKPESELMTEVKLTSIGAFLICDSDPSFGRMIWLIVLVAAIVVVGAIFAFHCGKKNEPKSEKEKDDDEDKKMAGPQKDKMKPSKKEKESKILKIQKHSPEMVSKPRKRRLQKRSLVTKSQEKKNKRALMAVSKALSLMSRKRAKAKQNIQQMKQLRDLSSISTVAKSTWKSTATFTWKSTATITSTETDPRAPPKQLLHSSTVSTLTLPPKTTKMNLEDSDSSQKKHQQIITKAISNRKVSIIKPKTQVISSGIIQLINQWTHE